ncbi:hypothetical protein MGAST_18870 [Mycobacterium gastri 'Wayne']|uniref:Uncharacterized protein n=1 Tax=Mycobacterium gastri TaxID=1777 RepID=A0A1X1VKW5_MYCGS|nr:hypothetical protein MGAST_18870 [Mycobacterium gastri 'Wayne']ORV69691.1 hypothetical protein AWC07_06505 [Mycobacterium gastri]
MDRLLGMNSAMRKFGWAVSIASALLVTDRKVPGNRQADDDRHYAQHDAGNRDTVVVGFAASDPRSPEGSHHHGADAEDDS